MSFIDVCGHFETDEKQCFFIRKCLFQISNGKSTTFSCAGLISQVILLLVSIRKTQIK